MKRFLSLILVETFLFTTVGSELAWSTPSASRPMLLRSRSVAQDGNLKEDLKKSLQQAGTLGTQNQILQQEVTAGVLGLIEEGEKKGWTVKQTVKSILEIRDIELLPVGILKGQFEDVSYFRKVLDLLQKKLEWDAYWKGHLSKPEDILSGDSTTHVREKFGLILSTLQDFGNLRGKRILEIGPGPGELLHYLQDEFGAEVVGIEISDYARMAAEERGVQMHEDFEELEAAGEAPFDIVISFRVFEENVLTQEEAVALMNQANGFLREAALHIHVTAREPYPLEGLEKVGPFSKNQLGYLLMGVKKTIPHPPGPLSMSDGGGKFKKIGIFVGGLLGLSGIGIATAFLIPGFLIKFTLLITLGEIVAQPIVHYRKFGSFNSFRFHGPRLGMAVLLGLFMGVWQRFLFGMYQQHLPLDHFWHLSLRPTVDMINGFLFTFPLRVFFFTLTEILTEQWRKTPSLPFKEIVRETFKESLKQYGNPKIGITGILSKIPKAVGYGILFWWSHHFFILNLEYWRTVTSNREALADLKTLIFGVFFPIWTTIVSYIASERTTLKGSNEQKVSSPKSTAQDGGLKQFLEKYPLVAVGASLLSLALLPALIHALAFLVALYKAFHGYFPWQTDMVTGALLAGLSDLVGQWIAYRAKGVSILTKQVGLVTLLGAVNGWILGRFYQGIEPFSFWMRIGFLSLFGLVKATVGTIYALGIGWVKRHWLPHFKGYYEPFHQIEKFVPLLPIGALIGTVKHLSIQLFVPPSFWTAATFVGNGINALLGGWALNRAEVPFQKLSRFLIRHLDPVWRFLERLGIDLRKREEPIPSTQMAIPNQVPTGENLPQEVKDEMLRRMIGETQPSLFKKPPDESPQKDKPESPETAGDGGNRLRRYQSPVMEDFIFPETGPVRIERLPLEVGSGV